MKKVSSRLDRMVRRILGPLFRAPEVHQVSQSIRQRQLDDMSLQWVEISIYFYFVFCLQFPSSHCRALELVEKQHQIFTAKPTFLRWAPIPFPSWWRRTDSKKCKLFDTLIADILTFWYLYLSTRSLQQAREGRTTSSIIDCDSIIDFDRQHVFVTAGRQHVR